MLRVVTYLLPLSGELLLERLDQNNRVEIVAAFVPKTYYSDCTPQMQWLENQEIPYRAPDTLDSESLRDWVESLEVDLGISMGYDKKLPEWLYDHPTGGTINFHPSSLPEYRGANPYYWVLRNQEDRTGVTLHYMDENFDTGPIVEKREIDVEAGETMGTLFFKLNNTGLDLFEDIIEETDRSGNFPESIPQKQPEDSIPEAPRVQERHLRIDWDEPFEEIDARVRAANPFLGAYTSFKGTKIRIYEVTSIEVPESARAEDSPAEPGRIHATENGPAIRCRDGWLRPGVVQVGQSYKASGLEFQRREKNAFDVLERVI